MLKLFVTLVLLGAFLGQSKGDVGDACYSCTWDSTDSVDTTDSTSCQTITSVTKKDLLATTAKPYCYTSVVGTTTTRGITSLNVCGKEDSTLLSPQTFSTCSGALCNNDAATAPLTVKNCPVKEVTPDCPAGNSGTKANRGFGVIMTSVSLSYVITKFL